MVTTDNIEKKAAIIFIYITSAILALLWFLSGYYPASLISLGGSIIFIPLVGWLILSSGLVKPIAFESSSFALIVSGILVINFVGYIEKVDIKMFLGYADILVFFYLILYYIIVKSVMIPVKSNRVLNEMEQKIKKNLFMTLISAFLIIWIVIFNVVADARHIIFDMHSFFSHSTISLTLTIVALIVTTVLFLRINDNDIKQVIKEEKYQALSYSPTKIKKYFYLFFLVVIVTGSIIEIQRGLWLLWYESILCLGLVLIIHWKVYKHFFKEIDATYRTSSIQNENKGAGCN